MSSQSDIEEKRGVDDIGNSTLPIAAPAPVAAPPAVGPPPNGGLKAWSQVLGAFFLMVNTW
jgi:hypothetical protein